MANKYKLINIGQVSEEKTIHQYGKSYRQVAATIMDTIEKSSISGQPIVYNLALTVYEDETQRYINLSTTRFKEFGKIYI